MRTTRFNVIQQQLRLLIWYTLATSTVAVELRLLFLMPVGSRSPRPLPLGILSLLSSLVREQLRELNQLIGHAAFAGGALFQVYGRDLSCLNTHHDVC